MARISTAEQDLQILMYARYGELGEGMDGKVLAARASSLLANERLLKTVMTKALKNEIYGIYLNQDSFMDALRRLQKDYSEDNLIQFKNVEQAFQYAKTYFSNAKDEDLAQVRKAILASDDGLSLRSAGRLIPDLDVKQWDEHKYDIMKDLIRESFLQNPDKALAFVEKTDGFTLTHEQDKSEWKELFPKALMEVREEIKQVYSKKKSEEEKIPVERYMEERFDFHVGSCRSVINDNLETVNLPEPEVNGIALRNTISDAVEAGYERKDIKDCLLKNYKNLETTVEQQIILDRAFKELTGGKEISLNTGENFPQQTEGRFGIVFTSSEGQYSKRTYENANADDVDFTFRFALKDKLNTSGERCTAKAAGDSLITVILPVDGKGHLLSDDKAIAGCFEQLKEQLPDEFLEGEPFGVNIAGNGIYTLSGACTQTELDVFMLKFSAAMSDSGMKLSSVRSGGQTGVDESAVVIASHFGIPLTVHGPSDWSYMDSFGKDIRGNMEGFRKRFDKDFAGLRKKAGLDKGSTSRNVKSKQVSM